MDMQTAAEFDREIRKLTKGFPDARPFLCNGSPFGCQVFLVGINPATDTDFWKHWSSDGYCDKSAWLDDYRDKHGKCGPTRKRIEIFFEHVVPVKALETNIFASYAAKEAGLSTVGKDTRLFDYLVETIRPKLLIGHGKSVREYFDRVVGKSLVHGAYEHVQWRCIPLEVRVEHHLSYHWSDQRVAEFGEEVKSRYL